MADITGELLTAVYDVCKYWRDWPQARRDAVRDLSPYVADAIEKLCAVVEPAGARAGADG